MVETPLSGFASTIQQSVKSGSGERISPIFCATHVPPVRQNGTSAPTLTPTAQSSFNVKPAEKISLSEISSHLGFSKYYFSKLFNSYMKCSFESYLASIRLTKFIEQLKPDTNITKLAFDCGFESISSFYRNFKNTLGTTPRQIQKMLSQNNGKL